MSIVRDNAVVLRHYPFSETSQVIVVYGRSHGKVRLIAKGVKRSTRRRFAPAIDMLEEGQLAFSPRKESADALSILTEWKQVRSFAGLRDRLERIRAAQYIAEITGMLTVDFDPHPELYEALTCALFRLSAATTVLPIITDFQWRLLDSAGLAPRLDACVLCDQAGPLTHFSSLEGGMVCRSCEAGQIEKRSVPSSVLMRLRMCESATNFVEDEPPGSGGSTSDMTETFELLNYHIAHCAGRKPTCAVSVLLSNGSRRP